MTLEEVRKVAASVEGFLEPQEIAFLYNRGRDSLPNGVIVEIGSWQGKSTVCIAAGSQAGNNVPLYAIDPHQDSYVHVPLLGKGVSTFEIFKKNIERAGVHHVVRPIVSLSREAAKGWDKPISFLWIDGDHDYGPAREDLDLFYDHVVEGGLVAFHDATYEQVKSVVKDTLLSKPFFADAGIAGTIVYARKQTKKALNSAQKLQRAYVRLLVNGHDWFRAVKLPASLRGFVKKIGKPVIDRV